MKMQTERDVISMCLALLRNGQDSLSPDERELINDFEASELHVSKDEINSIRKAILKGTDPLGDAFSNIRSPAERRVTGAVYTPLPIVRSMIAWLLKNGCPDRVVDPGAGSGRFILAAGAAFPLAQLIAIEKDPLAALMLRANIHTRGWSDRATVLVRDYREIQLSQCEGITAFIGNPPYVRHHDIGSTWKHWYSSRFSELGIKASSLAGLHLHFFLQTLLLSKKGDIGAFITSAEWLDVNYGSALRKLLTKELGGVGLHVLEPTTEAFPGTATTAAITCFQVGDSASPIKVQSVANLNKLNGLSKGVNIPREKLHDASRWSIIIRPSKIIGSGEIEIGDLFRVHRGQVTGANSIWIAGEHSSKLPGHLLIDCRCRLPRSRHSQKKAW